MVIAGLFVLGGGGAGAYYYFFVGTAQAAASHESGEIAEAAKISEEDEVSVKPEYVKLDPLILPIVGPEGATQIVSLVVTIEVPDIAAAEALTGRVPRLKDAYIQDLYGTLSRQASTEGGVVEVSTIKARLNDITRRVMGEDFKGDVLLQVVQQRPI